MANSTKGIPLLVPLFVLFMGCAALLNAISSPHFELFRRFEVVRLIAAGMCFGAALVWLVMLFVGSRSK